MNINVSPYFQYVPFNLLRNYVGHVIVCSVVVVRSHYNKGLHYHILSKVIIIYTDSGL